VSEFDTVVGVAGWHGASQTNKGEKMAVYFFYQGPKAAVANPPQPQGDGGGK
jgi:hypothetical protein